MATPTTKTKKPSKDALPLGIALPFDELTERYWRAVEGLSEGWRPHVGEGLHRMALLHVARGESALAARQARRVPDDLQRLVALSDVAWALAGADRPLAAALLAEAEVLWARDETTHRPWKLARLLPARHALGDARAAAQLDEADDDAWLQSETNPFEHVCHLAAGFLRVGREDAAHAVLDKGPWTFGYAPTFLGRYLVERTREGFLDHALAVGRRCVERSGRGLDFAIFETLAEALSRAERHADALEWLSLQSGYSTDRAEERVRADLAEHDPAAVHAMLEASARASRWPPQIARCLRELGSAGAPGERVASLLGHFEAVLEAEGVYTSSAAELAADLGQALARTGLSHAVDAMLRRFDAGEPRLALLCGLVRGSEGRDGAEVDGWLDLAEALARKQDDAGARARALTGVAVAARTLRPERAGADLAEALAEVASVRTGDRRFVLSDMTSQLLAGGDLTGAYLVWRKQTKGMRRYESRPLIEALARRGELAAVVAVIEQVAQRPDDLNGAAQDLRVAAELYVHGRAIH